METGTQALASISAGVRLIHDQVEEADGQIRRTSEAIVELRKKQAENYKRIARIRLDNVVSGELEAGLDAAGRHTAELLESRGRDLDALEAQIAAARAAGNELERRREELDAEAARADEVLDAAEAEVQRGLEQDPAYLAQLEKAQQAERTAGHAEEKTRQAEAAYKEKGAPYEQYPLFSYLWQRGYGTSAYSANALVRYLDGWVARLARYDDARPNYARLAEIPQRLGEHAARLRAVADEEFAALTRIEEAAAADAGVPALRQALDEARGRVDEIDKRIDESEATLVELERKRAEFARGEDDRFRQAVDALTGAFERESLITLYEYARSTATAEDDVLVQEMERIRDEVTRLEETLREQSQVRERLLARMQDLEDVRRRFKAERYDSPQSGFGNAAMLVMLLNQFLQGAASSGDLWRTIERSQRYRRKASNPDFGSGGFPHRRGTWNIPFPRGGGSRRGGFGGGKGGFRTGGGF